MSALVLRLTPWTVWLALFMSTLAFLFAAEGTALRLYDWARPPITMAWEAETLPDGRYAVRFSGIKHRGECDLMDVRAWGRSADGDMRLSVKRDGPALNRRLPAGPFGPTAPWVLIPPPTGDPRIVAEFDCRGREVVVEARRL